MLSSVVDKHATNEVDALPSPYISFQYVDAGILPPPYIPSQYVDVGIDAKPCN